MAWLGRTVLVTGGGGFVGSHLVERLVSLGATTKALVHYNSAGSAGWLDGSPVRDSVEILAGEIWDGDGMRGYFRSVDAVFHVAALSSVPDSHLNPRAYIRTNVEGTLNVLQAALDMDVELVVHTSTSQVYGTARYIPIDEEHPLQAQSPYAATKIAADKLAESFYDSYQLPVAIIRPFNTYGPRQSSRAVIPAIINQALTQPQVRLRNLAPELDFNFVADTVEGYIRIAECPAAVGQVINIGSGQGVSIGDLAGTILKLMGRDTPVVQDGQPKAGVKIERLCADNSKANDLLGWQPQYTLEQGLAQTIDWMRGDLQSYPIDSGAGSIRASH